MPAWLPGIANVLVTFVATKVFVDVSLIIATEARYLNKRPDTITTMMWT